MLNKIKTFFLKYYGFIIIIGLSILDFFIEFTGITEGILLLIFISGMLHVFSIDYEKNEYKKIKKLLNYSKYTIGFFTRTIFVIGTFYILLYLIGGFESFIKPLITLSLKDIISIIISLFFINIGLNILFNNNKSSSINYENWFHGGILILLISTYTFIYLSSK